MPTTIVVKASKPKTIKQLQKMAQKAGDARDEFSDALELAKQQPDWREKCDMAGICDDATAADWMC